MAGKDQETGFTMDPMPTPPAHAKPARRDLLWVLILIAVCGLLEVWASWLQIGSVSGFPKLGAMTTGWILPVTTEAYWTAALYAWLVDPAGPRSKGFAIWSGAAVFALSLAGQESDHLLAAAHRAVPPVWVVGGVTALPLIAVALVAVLMHLRQADREAAAESARRAAIEAELITAETAAADERTALRAELEALAGEVEPLREALAAAQDDARQANAKAESLAAKLAAQKPKRTQAKTTNAGRRKTANGPANAAANGPANGMPEMEVPDDFDARAEALDLYLSNPQISGKELGEAVGLTARWGQLRKAEFAKAATGSERSGEHS